MWEEGRRRGYRVKDALDILHRLLVSCGGGGGGGNILSFVLACHSSREFCQSIEIECRSAGVTLELCVKRRDTFTFYASITGRECGGKPRI